METTPRLFGSNWENTRSKAASSSSFGESGLVGSMEGESEGVGDGRDEAEMDLMRSSLSFAILTWWQLRR